MGMLRHIAAPEGVAAGRGYSQVVAGRGRLVVVSGQVAQDEHGELVGAGDADAQARQVFENLRRCLAGAGAGFGDVVKLACGLPATPLSTPPGRPRAPPFRWPPCSPPAT
jgi:enamine deaminase RidA (YjgF/YER057c/UK114 family)